MQGRESLRQHLASQHQVQSGDYDGQEEQAFNVSFHWKIVLLLA